MCERWQLRCGVKVWSFFSFSQARKAAKRKKKIKFKLAGGSWPSAGTYYTLKSYAPKSAKKSTSKVISRHNVISLHHC